MHALYMYEQLYENKYLLLQRLNLFGSGIYKVIVSS